MHCLQIAAILSTVNLIYAVEGNSYAKCNNALGIESGAIRDYQMYASSESQASWLYALLSSSMWSAKIARLHNSALVNAWMPRQDSKNEWLEVDLSKPTAVTGIVTQGASRFFTEMWVTSYLIQSSKDGKKYKTIEENGKHKEFDGNVDNNGLKKNMFPEPVLTRYIRFIPLKYHNNIALRIELLGCDLNTFDREYGLRMRAMEAELVTVNEYMDVEDIAVTEGIVKDQEAPPENA